MGTPQIEDISINIIRNSQENPIEFMSSSVFNAINGTISFEIVNSRQNFEDGYNIQNNICY